MKKVMLSVMTLDDILMTVIVNGKKTIATFIWMIQDKRSCQMVCSTFGTKYSTHLKKDLL